MSDTQIKVIALKDVQKANGELSDTIVKMQQVKEYGQLEDARRREAAKKEHGRLLKQK